MTTEDFKAGIREAIATELVERQSRHIFNEDLDDIVDSVYAYVVTATYPARFIQGEDERTRDR